MNKKYGLYIHIPFCVKKCAYCDFPSYSGKDEFYNKYINTLLYEALKYKGLEVDTIFIGGGTPTCLSEKQLDTLLNGINKNFSFSDGTEFTVEANPGTVTDEKLLVLKNGGVNRLSIGVQSFNNKELEFLGRIHDKFVALKTIESAHKYFNNVNIDIMTALPNQNWDSLLTTLKAAVSTGAEHMSCYSLILEEGTPLYELYYNKKLELPSDECDREMFHNLCSYLKDNGYERYEISNFAKPEKSCRHNLKYWNAEEYIGLGAAAHSYKDGKRFNNPSTLDAYFSAPGEPEQIINLSEQDMMAEFVIMALRTSKGVNFERFYNKFGKSFIDVYKKNLDKFLNTDLINIGSKGFSLTEKGFDVSNSIMCEFI